MARPDPDRATGDRVSDAELAEIARQLRAVLPAEMGATRASAPRAAPQPRPRAQPGLAPPRVAMARFVVGLIVPGLVMIAILLVRGWLG